MMLLRVQERAGWYILAMVAEVLVLIGAAYVFMVVQGLGLTGLMMAYALSAGVGAVVLVAVMLGVVPWRFERRLVQVLIAFGMPLVVASFAGWFLNAGDRYLLKWLTDATTVGLYEWAARLAGVLNMLFVQSFNLAFSVIGLKKLGTDARDGQMHRQTLRHYVVWTGWAVLGLSLLSYDLTRLLPADPLYLQAETIVLLLALGFMNYGIYYVIINVVYATGRTGVISLNVLFAALLNAGLNIALIPPLGVMGAALATFVAYLALALGAAYFTKQDLHVRFPWRAFLIVVPLVVGLYWLGRPSIDWSFGLRFAARAALVVAYPLLILLTRLYTWAEVRGVWQVLRERRGSGG
jgi:O-antigen/teichoic acid export membrane protein